MVRVLTLVLVSLVLLPGMAAAQTPNVVNPRVIEFTPSADHAVVTSYEVAYFAEGASEPVMAPVDIGKPEPNASQVCSVTITVAPVPFGLAYTAKVRAKAGELLSPWSDPSNPFDRQPESPSNLRLAR